MRHLGRVLLVPGCPAAALNKGQRAMPANYDESASKPGAATTAGKRKKRSVMEWPCDRWSMRLMEDWAATAPSCCVIW